MTRMDKKIYDAFEMPPGVANALAHGLCDDPFCWLGLHAVAGGVVMRAVLPGVDDAEVVLGVPASLRVPLQRWSLGQPLFGVFIPDAQVTAAYRLRLRQAGNWSEIEDPYSFPSTLEVSALASFCAGTEVHLHHWMGAVPLTLSQRHGYRFAVWAPNASRVSVVGDFNQWDGRVHVMRRHPAAGVWELFIPGTVVGQHYKYEILAANGDLLLRSDGAVATVESVNRDAACFRAGPDGAAHRCHGTPPAAVNL